MRLLALLAAGALGLGLWWYLDDDPEPREPSEAEKIIEFCSDLAHKANPLCTVENPEDPEAVRDAVQDAIERQTIGPQIIERETIRDRDDDDGSDSRPQVNVTVPRDKPQSTPTLPPPRRPTPAPTTTQPPLVIEIPEVPAPNLPDVGLPLLP